MLQLTGKPLEICPEHCEHMEIETNTTCLYCDTGLYMRQDDLHCRHEKACVSAYKRGKATYMKSIADQWKAFNAAFDLGRKDREGGAE